MSLKTQLTADMKEAMKAKEKERLTTIRQIKATLQNEEIKFKKELNEDEEIVVINREVKQTKESLEGYKSAPGDYDEKIEELQNSLNVLMTYLPKQLSEDEVVKIVQETIEAIGATSKGDMGKVMGAVMPKLKGKADGKLINQTVSNLLN